MSLVNTTLAFIASVSTSLGTGVPKAARLAASCETALINGELLSHQALQNYDAFVKSFVHWRRDGLDLVGRKGRAEWRIRPHAAQMIYSWPIGPEHVHRLEASRRLAQAALRAFSITGELDFFAANVVDGRVSVQMPFDPSGLRFVINLSGESEGCKAFRPVPLEKVRRIEREVLRGERLTFEYDDHLENMYDDQVVAGAARWLAGQTDLSLSPNIHLHPIEQRITVDLPARRGLGDLSLLERRAKQLFADAQREGAEVSVSTERIDQGLRVSVPWSLTGLELIHRLSGVRAELIGARRSHLPVFTADTQMPGGDFLNSLLLIYGPWRAGTVESEGGEGWTTTFGRVDLTILPRERRLLLGLTAVSDGRRVVETVLVELLRASDPAALAAVNVSNDGQVLSVPVGPTGSRVLTLLNRALAGIGSCAVTESELAQVRNWQYRAPWYRYNRTVGEPDQTDWTDRVFTR